MSATVRIGNRLLTNRVLPSFLTGKSKTIINLENSIHLSRILQVAGVEIKMPSLSPTMAEGTIVKWLKKEGDIIAPGDVLCEIQTDKAVVSFETEEEGVLAKILIPEDIKEVKVGTLIGLMVAEGENWKDVEIPTGTQLSSSQTSTSISGDSSTSCVQSRPDVHHESVMGPAVHRLLEQYGLKAKELQGTGPKGNLLKGDILNAVIQRGLKPCPPSNVPLPTKIGAVKSASIPAISTKVATVKSMSVRRGGSKFVDIEVSNMRRTIAKRLTESKTTIPHAYGNIECDITDVTKLRQQLKSDGIAISVNDFIIKAVAVALKQCPLVNCIWTGDKAVPVTDIDISVAVATDSGLITPIVKGASNLGVQEISSAIRDLALRAKLGKLQLHEFQGGTFTISNLGMFGVNHFSAIINPPQCGILAVGGSKNVVENSGDIKTKIIATLSYDRRAIDEDEAANFLLTLQQILSHPSRLLLGSIPTVDRARIGD